MLARVLPFLISVPLALSAAACSDPPPTPPAAGVSMTLGPPDKPYSDSRTCNAGTLGSFTYQIGKPDSGGTIEDGQQHTSVSCLVTASGSFSGSISGNDENAGKPAAFSFAGTIADRNNQAANTGLMTSTSPDTGPMTSAIGPGCTFNIPANGTLKKGAILADINCPLIGPTDDVASGCSVTGTIAFEYCKTGEEAN